MKEKRILIRDCSSFRGLPQEYCRVAVKLQEHSQRFLTALEGMLPHG